MADPLFPQSAIDRFQSAPYELVMEGEFDRHRQKPVVGAPQAEARTRGGDGLDRSTPRRDHPPANAGQPRSRSHVIGGGVVPGL